MKTNSAKSQKKTTQVFNREEKRLIHKHGNAYFIPSVLESKSAAFRSLRRNNQLQEFDMGWTFIGQAATLAHHGRCKHVEKKAPTNDLLPIRDILAASKTLTAIAKSKKREPSLPFSLTRDEAELLQTALSGNIQKMREVHEVITMLEFHTTKLGKAKLIELNGLIFRLGRLLYRMDQHLVMRGVE